MQDRSAQSAARGVLAAWAVSLFLALATTPALAQQFLSVEKNAATNDQLWSQFFRALEAGEASRFQQTTAKLRTFLRPFAEQGDAEAQYLYAVIPPRDGKSFYAKDAGQWLQRSADAGYPPAMAKLADPEFIPEKVRMEDPRAAGRLRAQRLERAARLCWLPAQQELATLHSGIGADEPHDPDLHFAWTYVSFTDGMIGQADALDDVRHAYRQSLFRQRPMDTYLNRDAGPAAFEKALALAKATADEVLAQCSAVLKRFPSLAQRPMAMASDQPEFWLVKHSRHCLAALQQQVEPVLLKEYGLQPEAAIGELYEMRNATIEALLAIGGNGAVQSQETPPELKPAQAEYRQCVAGVLKSRPR
jgi:hypothetical protein